MYTFKVWNIDFAVEDEDVEGILYDELTAGNDDVYEDIDFDYETIENKRKEIIDKLPAEMRIEVDGFESDWDLEDKLADAISEETGWLVNGFNYELIDKVNGRYENGNI